MVSMIIVCLFLTCANISDAQDAIVIKEPESEESTLLIGQIVLTANNFPAQPPFNGTHTYGIQLQLQDPNTKEIIKLTSVGISGFFLMYDPPSDFYRITRIYIKVEKAGYTRELFTTINRYIHISKGRVNNLGLFKWYADNETGDFIVYYNDDYAQVRNLFNELTQGDSIWLYKQWERWADVMIE